jgi:hypothetical protein
MNLHKSGMPACPYFRHRGLDLRRRECLGLHVRQREHVRLLLRQCECLRRVLGGREHVGMESTQCESVGLKITKANLPGAAISESRLDGMTINGVPVTELLAVDEANKPKQATGGGSDMSRSAGRPGSACRSCAPWR